MNKEQIEQKAIEEMAEVIANTENIAKDMVGALPSPTMYAKDLYWRGYRKQIDIALEIFEEIEKVILDNTYPDFDSKHKPVNVWKATTGYDAFYELKKKYTEDKT